jgi:NAD(P)H-dependent flavin oxidoreductase YrpB (nitropropane dioxygenase family)|eukprot:CAMPEP_0119170770 /NCGR_PEP_ID=MMETSP1315-20130426/20954_1 /TAXON_ID=676789 /ORGANISM="Prasinoderma singularis, Strain RCC927" /LENGTH=362 /DNA_ID=CAMNT_0007164547 /DNA_START=65 /DNA_END=1153 /DNA_ORIENTATION=+
MAPSQVLKTPATELFGIKHPVLLAGMNVAAGPRLAAAVTNAGGMGVIGGVGYTPEQLQQNIDDLVSQLDDKNAPYGVDLLLPKVGSGARATNYDYTKGQLGELIDVIIKNKAKLFVCAVGVPPREVVDKMHAAGIPVMNMVGAVKHVKYALDVGCDIICAQGGEGGGHTGAVPTSVLIPKVIDACRGRSSPLTGGPVQVIAAGGIFDSRGLAMSLAAGASAVWVGTRFVAAEEAGAPPRHKKGVVAAGYDDTHRTLIYTGRPLRIIKNDYSKDWETNRSKECAEVCAKGKLPFEYDVEKREKDGKPFVGVEYIKAMPLLCGAVAGAIDEVLPAKAIVDEMVSGAAKLLASSASFVVAPQARM